MLGNLRILMGSRQAKKHFFGRSSKKNINLFEMIISTVCIGKIKWNKLDEKSNTLLEEIWRKFEMDNQTILIEVSFN